MHTETLVDSDVADGRKLIDALQKAGVRIKAALWYFGTEMNEWRLMIQLPLSNEYHHRSAFEEIEKVRRTLGPQFHLPLRKIAVQSQHSHLVNTVRKKVEKNGGVTGRVSITSVSGFQFRKGWELTSLRMCTFISFDVRE